MAEQMTEADWQELDRLCRKAQYDPSTSEKSADVLSGVSIYASRMGGG